MSIKRAIDQILDQTHNGQTIYEHFFGWSGKRSDKFKIRDEKTPSAAVKEDDYGKWVFNDYGGADVLGITNWGDAIDAVRYSVAINEQKQISQIEALRFIAREMSLEVFFTDSDKEYNEPKAIPKGIDKGMGQYLTKVRCLSSEALEFFGIATQERILRSEKKEIKKPYAVFPYFSASGKHLNNKYITWHKTSEAKIKKDCQNDFNTKRSLFNIQNVNTGIDAVVVVEGEIDAISIFQVAQLYGLNFIPVSVPNGCSTWAQCDEDIDRIRKTKDSQDKPVSVYIFTDKDENGYNLEKEIIKSFGSERCYKVVGKGFKDANEMLIKAGEESIAEVLANAEPFPVEGEIIIKNIFNQLRDFYKYGEKEGVKLKLGRFDDHLNFSLGQLTLGTGTPGSGKTTFLLFLTVQLAKLHGWKWCLFSPESGGYLKLIDQLVRIYTNKARPQDAEKLRDTRKLSEQEWNDAVMWVSEHFTIITEPKINEDGTQEELTTEWILSRVKSVVRRDGIKGVFLDPYNKIQKLKGQDEMDHVRRTLNKIQSFSEHEQVHTILVAHPRKMDKIKSGDDAGEYDVVKPYDIAGSADFFNIAFNIVSVWRRKNSSDNVVSIHIQKVKFDKNGDLGVCEFNFDAVSKSYTPIELVKPIETKEPDPLEKEYAFDVGEGDNYTENPPF